MRAGKVVGGRGRWLVCVGLILGCVGWFGVGCTGPSVSARKARLKSYPKMSHRVAKSMMLRSLRRFRRSLRRADIRDGRGFRASWEKMVNEIKPLLVSLRSYDLLGFRRQVIRSRRRTPGWYRSRLPGGLKRELEAMMGLSAQRIARAKKVAMRSEYAAYQAIQEAQLEDNSGVSKRTLRRKRKPRRKTRRAARRRYPSLGLLYPMPGKKMGSPYGWRRGPISGRWGFHTGVDIGARRGRPILAAASGRVLRARRMGGCGYGVILLHPGLGYKRVTTTYCHMSRILVRRGQKIRRGQRIGLIGSTGNSTGPHLHFAIHINRKHVNPAHHFQSVE